MSLLDVLAALHAAHLISDHEYFTLREQASKLHSVTICFAESVLCLSIDERDKSYRLYIQAFKSGYWELDPSDIVRLLKMLVILEKLGYRCDGRSIFEDIKLHLKAMLSSFDS